MASPYPWYYTLRWPFYFRWPSTRNHTGILPQPLQQSLIVTNSREHLKLLFCGDIMIMQKDIIPTLHDDLCQLINSTDLFIGNCESPVGEQPLNKQARYRFCFNMPRIYLRTIIQQAGLPAKQWILSMANNHTGDQGYQAALNTETILKELGIKPIGRWSYSNPIRIVESKGLRIGLLAWTHWMNNDIFPKHDPGAYRFEHFRDTNWQVIKQEHQLDTLIGIPHWEYEFQHFPTQATRHLAKTLIDTNGIDLLVGIHPHTLQPMEHFNKGLCFYSLGNFCGLGVAWPVKLIPLLEIKLGLTPPHQGKILNYQIYLFLQQHSDNKINLIPLDKVVSKSRQRFIQRLKLLYQTQNLRI